MRFLVDAQLPPRLAKSLLELGHDASHVADIGLLAASVRQIWREAIERSAALITKDRDFAVLRASRSGGPAVVWLRIGNATNDELMRRLVAVLGSVVEAIDRGETLVEVIA